MKELLDTGTITRTLAADTIASLSEDEQEELLKRLDITQKITKREIQQYIDRIKQLEEIGIFLGDKKEKYFADRMNLAKQAIKDGVIICRTNEEFKGINLYNWVFYSVKTRYRKNELLDEEITVIEKLIGKSLNDSFCGYGKYNNSIKVKDLSENKIIGIYDSLSEASREMKKIYGILIQPLTISKRLTGKVTTPYKDRFMFYYATDEEIKQYFSDNKAS